MSLILGTLKTREKVQIILELRQKHQFSILLKVLKISRTTYNYHCKYRSTEDKYKEIKVEIFRLFETENRRRRGHMIITQELIEIYKINHKTVLKLMRKM